MTDVIKNRWKVERSGFQCSQATPWTDYIKMEEEVTEKFQITETRFWNMKPRPMSLQEPRVSRLSTSALVKHSGTVMRIRIPRLEISAYTNQIYKTTPLLFPDTW